MMITANTTKTWLTWSECLEICEAHNVTRYAFLQIVEAKHTIERDGKLAEEYVLERKTFPGCSRRRYKRTSLLTLLGVS